MIKEEYELAKETVVAIPHLTDESPGDIWKSLEILLQQIEPSIPYHISEALEYDSIAEISSIIETISSHLLDKIYWYSHIKESCYDEHASRFFSKAARKLNAFKTKPAYSLYREGVKKLQARLESDPSPQLQYITAHILGCIADLLSSNSAYSLNPKWFLSIALDLMNQLDCGNLAIEDIKTIGILNVRLSYTCSSLEEKIAYAHKAIEILESVNETDLGNLVNRYANSHDSLSNEQLTEFETASSAHIYEARFQLANVHGSLAYAQLMAREFKSARKTIDKILPVIDPLFPLDKQSLLEMREGILNQIISYKDMIRQQKEFSDS